MPIPITVECVEKYPKVSWNCRFRTLFWVLFSWQENLKASAWLDLFLKFEHQLVYDATTVWVIFDSKIITKTKVSKLILQRLIHISLWQRNTDENLMIGFLQAIRAKKGLRMRGGGEGGMFCRCLGPPRGNSNLMPVYCIRLCRLADKTQLRLEM